MLLKKEPQVDQIQALRAILLRTEVFWQAPRVLNYLSFFKNELGGLGSSLLKEISIIYLKSHTSPITDKNSYVWHVEDDGFQVRFHNDYLHFFLDGDQWVVSHYFLNSRTRWVFLSDYPEGCDKP